MEILDLQDVGTRLFNESDGAAFNDLLASLTEITEGKRGDVRRIIEGARPSSPRRSTPGTRRPGA